MKSSKLPILILLVCALSLTGCGKFLDKFGRLASGFTEVRFVHDRAGLKNPGLIRLEDPIHSLVELAGGVVVYARNKDTGSVFSINGASENDPNLKLTLPWGSYEFYGVGWPTSNLTGAPTAGSRVRCGYAPDKTFSDKSDTVELDLTNLENCHLDSFFTPAIAQSTSPSNSIAALTIIPCGKHVDFSGKDYTGTCEDSESSSYFFKGDPYDSNLGRGELFPASNSLMFTAAHDVTAEPYGLYRFDFATGRQTRVPVTFTGNVGVRSIQKVPQREQLVYIVDSGGVNELWLYKLSDGSTTRLDTGGAYPLFAGTDGPQEFRLSDDGNYVVWVADAHSDGILELYSVYLGGASYPPPERISGDTVPVDGLGVRKCSGCGGDEQYYFEIKPGTSNPYVLFAASKAGASNDKLYFATLDGSNIASGSTEAGGFSDAESGLALNATEITLPGSFTDEIGFSADGARVMYHVQDNGVSKVSLMNITFDGTSLAATAPTTIIGANAAQPFYEFGHTTKAVAFAKTTGPDHLIVKMFDITDPVNTIHQSHDISVPSNYWIGQVQFTPTDSKVVYSAYDSTSSPTLYTKLLFADDVTTANNTATNTAVDLTNGQVTVSKTIAGVSSDHQGEVFRLAASNTKVIFIADINNTGVNELFSAPLAGGTNPTQLSPAGIDSATKRVKSFSVFNNGKVYFNADVDGNGAEELYEADPTGSPAAAAVALPSQVKRVHDVSNDDDSLTTGFPITVSFEGGPNMEEMMLYRPTAGTFQRITKFSGAIVAGSPDDKGAGRMQVRWMMNPSGNAPVTAFSSECLAYTSSSIEYDGEPIYSSVRVPIGDGSSGRFPVEIDIFPLAGSCTGPAVTYSFPHGLFGPPVAGASYAKIDGQASPAGSLRLFLREK